MAWRSSRCITRRAQRAEAVVADQETVVVRVTLVLPPAWAGLRGGMAEAEAEARRLVRLAVERHLAAVREALQGVQGAGRAVPALELVELEEAP